MKRFKKPIMIGCLLFFCLATFLSLGQRQRRAPWEERSPAIGKKVPEVLIFDQDLDEIPIGNLHNNTLLVIQWGGCT